MADEEPKLTRAEWLRLEAKKQCGMYGHEWTYVYANNEIVSMFCDRNCGHPGYTLTLREKTQ